MNFYLVFGLGFYTATAIINYKYYHGASAVNILKGFVFGLLLWPIGIILLAYPDDIDTEDDA